jgi:hypothetical protein
MPIATPKQFIGYVNDKPVYIPGRPLETEGVVTTDNPSNVVSMTAATYTAKIVGYVQGSITNPDYRDYQFDWRSWPNDYPTYFPNDPPQQWLPRPFEDVPVEPRESTFNEEQLKKLREALEALKFGSSRALPLTPVSPTSSPAPKPAAEKQSFIGIDADVERDLEVG